MTKTFGKWRSCCGGDWECVSEAIRERTSSNSQRSIGIETMLHIGKVCQGNKHLLEWGLIAVRRNSTMTGMMICEQLNSGDSVLFLINSPTLNGPSHPEIPPLLSWVYSSLQQGAEAAHENRPFPIKARKKLPCLFR